jgi:tetratricopeptide (TPR) repeat protein
MQFRTTVVAAAAACLVLVPSAHAQAPTHKHYEKPPDAQAPPPGAPLAPRLQTLGTHTFKVSTKNARAQQFVNQGVNLAYGFNHAEAARAFAEAARLDAKLAMAYWGSALVIGPNINMPMAEADEPKALEFIRKAAALKAGATPRERDYIDALAKRYTGKAADRKTADRAYADAMRALAAKYPDDLDAATLAAEAVMDTVPWGYWTRDGIPADGVADAIAKLTAVIKRNPNHPGALHYWIHLWEPTRTPEKSESEADRLLPLMPGAGHMVHMPGHIYLRVGRYADAIKANEKAVAADEDYIAQCKAQGIYPLAYYPHNVHFIWFGATMTGQGAMAIEAARKIARVVPIDAVKDAPILQAFHVVQYFALVRFQKWQEIAAEPKPALDTAFTRGIWHYARGMAQTALGQPDAAQRELEALQAILKTEKWAEFGYGTAEPLLEIASTTLAGEMAAKRGDVDRALLHLERAVRLEDALTYTEPPDWHVSSRLALARILAQAGRHGEAEIVYWQDLEKFRENGWALFGLMKALKAQGKDGEAAAVEQRFKKAWKDADFPLDRVGS